MYPCRLFSGAEERRGQGEPKKPMLGAPLLGISPHYLLNKNDFAPSIVQPPPLMKISVSPTPSWLF